MTTERPAGMLREDMDGSLWATAYWCSTHQRAHTARELIQGHAALAALPGPDGLTREEAARALHAFCQSAEPIHSWRDHVTVALPGPDGLDDRIYGILTDYFTDTDADWRRRCAEVIVGVLALPATPDAAKGDPNMDYERRDAMLKVAWGKADHANRGAGDGA